MNDEGDIDVVLPLLEERAVPPGPDQEASTAEPEDSEVPPSGVLEPDPTGLGALA